jgi:glucose-1-phosphate cytidylyltransferase
MKVVLFCGGLGMRIREYSEGVPKPMITIGYRPILWHIMKYYAHHGHKDFILCLGHKAELIKEYFLAYNECLSNDFVLAQGGKQLRLLNSDIQDWRITFVDTGMSATIGQRLKAVQPYLDGEEAFMANYADGLTDLPLPAYLDHFEASGRTAAFVAVQPTLSFHLVLTADDVVTDIRPMTEANIWINGGYFILRQEIFRYLGTGEELVEQPFQRLVDKRQLLAYKYSGFWGCLDTFKEKQQLDELWNLDQAPWEVWKVRGRSVSTVHA